MGSDWEGQSAGIRALGERWGHTQSEMKLPISSGFAARPRLPEQSIPSVYPEHVPPMVWLCP